MTTSQDGVTTKISIHRQHGNENTSDVTDCSAGKIGKFQYLPPNVIICQSLSTLVSICQYENTSDDIYHGAGEVSI